jgi:hypothetical protein
MLAALLLVLVTLGLAQGLLRPLVLLLTPVLSLSWLGWVLLILFLWLLAGRSAQDTDPGGPSPSG